MSIGLATKDQKIKEALTVFSRSDFYHDFSDKDTVKQVLDKLINSRLLGSKLSAKAYAANLLKLRNELSNKSIYDFLERSYNTILPAGSKGVSLREEKLLKDILGFDYVDLQNKLRTFDRLKGLSYRALPDVMPLNISYASTLSRAYEVRAYPTKIRGVHYSIPHAFSTLSNESTKFVLIIDASFISLSSMRLDEMLKNQYIKDYDPKKEYTFYILQNSENSSDSATKIKKFDVGNRNIHVYLLKDSSGKRVVYPTYEDVGQGSNLYTDIELSTTINSDGTVDAQLAQGAQTYERKNIGRTSEINEASFLALQQYIENNNTLSSEILSYFFLKRAGDWCQALTLLDLQRTYEIYNEDNIKSGTTTLSDLIADDFTCGVVSHDRILLGYSLLLGLNVYFSMKIVSVDSSDEGVQDGNSIVWLVHFQNLETEINLENYAKLVGEKDAVLDAIKRCKHKAEEYIAETLKELQQIDVSQLKSTFSTLRLKLHVLKELHTVEEFTNLELKYINYFKDLKDLKDERKISILLRAIQECKKNIERLHEENSSTVLKKTYDTVNEEIVLLENLFNYTSADNLKDAKTSFSGVLEELKAELRLIRSKGISVMNLFENIDFKGNRKELGVYKYIVSNLEDSKHGGTLSLKSIHLNSAVDSKYINDIEGNFYSVVDSYIITKDHVALFKELFTNSTLDNYGMFRFLIYYLDELYTTLFSLNGQIPHEHGKSQYMEELFVEFIRIYYQLFNLEKYYATRDTLQIYNLYYFNRHKWTDFYLLGELHHYERYKEINNYRGIVKRINYKLTELYERIYKDYLGKKRSYRSVLSSSPAELNSTHRAKRQKKNSTHKNSAHKKSPQKN